MASDATIWLEIHSFPGSKAMTIDGQNTSVKSGNLLPAVRCLLFDYNLPIATAKIILFYTFAPIDNPEAIRLWQRSLCESLGLKGRIIISRHGINGTVGGPFAAVKKYVRITREGGPFKNIDFKWSDGDFADFPRLTIRVREEIVTFGIADEIQVDENGIVGGGKHLSPSQVHELIQERGEEVVFFDGRNAYEAAIGRFKNAVVPNVETSPGFVAELKTGKYDHLKNKPVITYCTGGIRCEVLSMAMKNRGFKEVFQIAGGIIRYGEQYKDFGLWEGSLYIFDKRMKIEFSSEAKIIGVCQLCESPARTYYNCANIKCHKLMLSCDECLKDHAHVNCSKCTPVNA